MNHVRTYDHHITRTPFLYQGQISYTDTRPTAKVLLLAGLLRGLWETGPKVDIHDLDIYIPDQSLVKSCRSPSD